jgi:serine/threonine protein kinase
VIEVSELFHRALELAPADRAAFLDVACAGDASLRAELESLLASHETAGTFMEAPPADAVRLIELADRSGASLVGQTLGQYEIRRVLGAGGMGVVYLAEDTRLGRTVALKAIAPQFAADHGRRERLRREARAAATLSHPNIATVYALEQSGDQLFIAAEYVAGETLREEINRGRQPLALVTETAVALARALALAHDRGILHRDLKPENVVRRPDGEVKILDFGLARALVPDTPATPPLTEDGARLGTPLYMSPEQLRGEALDGRSDLFALGLVIYELAAGTHPFAAGDQASTVARILEAEPPDVFASSSVDSQQAAFDAVLRRCLQKAPSRRYQSAAELAAAMEAVRQGRPAVLPSPNGSPHWWWRFHQAAICVVYSLMSGVMFSALGLGPQVYRFSISVLGAAAALTSITLRLHLWFTLQRLPAEWASQRAQTGRWIRRADLAFIAFQVLGAVAVLFDHRWLAMLLLAGAVTEFLAATVIEPATTRAAFD